jgi:hypothetical protein
MTKDGNKSTNTSGSRLCVKNVYSTPRGIVRSNCYAYSIGHYDRQGDPYKLQPGDLSTKKEFHLHDCSEVVARTREDLARYGGYPIKFNRPCKDGLIKIALILAPEVDYHFLVYHDDVRYLVVCDGETRKSIADRFKINIRNVEKLDSYSKGTSVYVKNAKCWSHKRGAAYPPSLMDSNFKIIKDPRSATFDYGELNYTVFCAAFCARSLNKTTGKNIPTVVTDDQGRLNVRKNTVSASSVRRVANSVKKNLNLDK